MQRLVIAIVLAGSASVAAAAPFRPFVDSIGVAPDGVIVTTTKASDQRDPPVARRHELIMFAPDGTELLAVRPESFFEHGVTVDARQWRALDRWVATLRLRRVMPAPLAELKCRTRPGTDDLACPAATDALVRTPTGLARWNPDGASPIWAWGESQVAERGR